jgi:hypothetical protein
MAENEEDRVIERLRASKAAEEGELTAAGRMAGQRWARDWAEYGALKRVATFPLWGGHDLPEVAYAGQLACLITDVDDIRELDRSDVRDLWQQLHDREEEPDPAWIEGFVEGATEVWDEVANKV